MKARVLEELKKIDFAHLVSDMVKIPSYTFLENQEKEIAEFIYDLLSEEGIESQLLEIRPGRYNVYGKIPGKGTGKSLMLSGHIDTVPAYDMEDAFSGRIEDGKIFGRGSCDMKGPIAAMLGAMIAIKRSGIKLAGDLWFTGLADEENESRGVEYLITHGPFCDATIMGEPTEMKIAIGHKGVEWINVYIEGYKVHGGNKDQGINAIEMAARFVTKVYQDYVPVLNARAYPVLGPPTINMGTISGGDQPSTVAGDCLIQLDRRCVPTETPAQVYEELQEICNRLHQEDPRFKAEIHDFFEGAGMIEHIPYCISAEDNIVKCIQAAMEGTVWDGEVSAFPAWSDAGSIASSKNGESKCVVMGPGNLGVAHSVHEYIKASDVENAAYVYGLTALEFCK